MTRAFNTVSTVVAQKSTMTSHRDIPIKTASFWLHASRLWLTWYPSAMHTLHLHNQRCHSIFHTLNIWYSVFKSRWSIWKHDIIVLVINGIISRIIEFFIFLNSPAKLLTILISKSLSCYEHLPAVLIKDSGKWNTIFLQNIEHPF